MDPELTGLASAKTIVSGGFPTWMSIASSPSQSSRVDLPFYDRSTNHLAPSQTSGVPLTPLSTKLFKLIRESSDHLLTNLEIPLVAGRKAAARAVREDERERKQRKDERRRKREGKEARREGGSAVAKGGEVVRETVKERGGTKRSGSGAGGTKIAKRDSDGDGALATTSDRESRVTKKKSVASSSKSATVESQSATKESKSRSRKSGSARPAQIVETGESKTSRPASASSPTASSNTKTKHQRGNSTSDGSVARLSHPPHGSTSLADAGTATARSKTTPIALVSPTPQSPRSPRFGSPDDHPPAGLGETDLSPNALVHSLAGRPSEENMSDQLASLVRRLVALQTRREELIRIERDLLAERDSVETAASAPAPRVARASDNNQARQAYSLRSSSRSGPRTLNGDFERSDSEEAFAVQRGPSSSLARIEEHEREVSEDTDHDDDVVDDVDDVDDVNDKQDANDVNIRDGGDGGKKRDDRDDGAGSSEPDSGSNVPTIIAHPPRTVSGWTGDLNRDADTAMPRSTTVSAAELDQPTEYSSDSSTESLDVATPTSPTRWRGVPDISGTEEGSVADTCTLSAWDAEPVSHAVSGKMSAESDAGETDEAWI